MSHVKSYTPTRRLACMWRRIARRAGLELLGEGLRWAAVPVVTAVIGGALFVVLFWANGPLWIRIVLLLAVPSLFFLIASVVQVTLVHPADNAGRGAAREPTPREIVEELARFARQYSRIAERQWNGQVDRVTGLMEIEKMDVRVAGYIEAWEAVAEVLGPSAPSRLLTERAGENRQLLFPSGDPMVIWRAEARSSRIREFIKEAESYFHLPPVHG